MKSATTPFDNPSADLIIRTSDHVNFSVFNVILSMASAYFKDMFSLTQPQKRGDSDGEVNDNLIADPIEVTEDSETMDILLRFCYPVRHPNITTLPALEKVLKAALKYQIEFVADITREQLRTVFINTSALRVFVVACQLGLEEEALLAAKRYKSVNGVLEDTIGAAADLFIPEMEKISTGCYVRLVHFLQQANNDSESSQSPHLTKPVNPFTGTISPPSTHFLRSSSADKCRVDMELFSKMEGTDVVLRSSVDGTEFKVHRSTLLLAQALSLLHSDEDSQFESTPVALPVYTVDIAGDVLAIILRLCYPMQSVDVPSFCTLRRIVEATERYKIKSAEPVLKKQMESIVNQDPITIYFFAHICGWHDVAEKAFQNISSSRLLTIYLPDMEKVSADVFHKILEGNRDSFTEKWLKRVAKARKEKSAAMGRKRR